MRPATAGRDDEHHSRGLARFDRVLRSAGVDSLSVRIERRLLRVRRVRLLEIGCGEGRLILDLLKRFGPSIELEGINHPSWPVIANFDGLVNTNTRRRVVPLRVLRAPDSAPVIHLADAENLRRFDSGSFDFVVSQVVLPHIVRKDLVLEESARLLKRGGTFIHDLDHLDGSAVEIGGSDLPRFAISRRGRTLSTTAFLADHDIALAPGRASVSRDVNIMAIHRRGPQPLRLGLRPDATMTVSLRALPRRADGAQPWGIRSVFRG